MPAAARLHSRARRPSSAATSLAIMDFACPPGPPSADLVAAILNYADVEDDAGGGRVRRRISAGRLADLIARGVLAAEAMRAADVAILWDEKEGEIVRVLDDARAVKRSDRAWWEDYFEEPSPPRARLSVAHNRANKRGVQ